MEEENIYLLATLLLRNKKERGVLSRTVAPDYLSSDVSSTGFRGGPCRLDGKPILRLSDRHSRASLSGGDR